MAELRLEPNAFDPEPEQRSGSGRGAPGSRPQGDAAGERTGARPASPPIQSGMAATITSAIRHRPDARGGAGTGRPRGNGAEPSNLRGMRLLLEESVLGLVGAFCVAAFALGAAWVVLEGVIQLNTVVAGLLATAAAGATLEGISRRQYEQHHSRQAPAPGSGREHARAEYRRAA